MNTRKETALYKIYVFNDAIPRSITGMYTGETASLSSNLSAVMSGEPQKYRSNERRTNEPRSIQTHRHNH
jgi:hypothetical protein